MIDWLIISLVVLLLLGLIFSTTWTLENAIAPAITGAVGGLVVALLLLDLGPELAEHAALRNPTCDDTRGAVPIPATVVNIPDSPATTGTAQEAEPPEQPYVKVDFHEATPSHPFPASVAEGDWDLENIVDGSTRTGWVPLDDEVDAKNAHVTFRLTEPMEVALVCVVNGNPTSEIHYQNAGRARTVTVTADERDAETVVLKSFGLDEMQNFQTLVHDVGEIESLQLNIVDTYPGLDAYDPESEMLSKPSGHVAIAEVVFYGRDPDVPSFWSLLWPG